MKKQLISITKHFIMKYLSYNDDDDDDDDDDNIIP